MKLETVSNIEITPGDSLLMVGLEGGGSPSYQYVYRAAAGVYWDNIAGAFKLGMKNDRRFAHWFAHLSKSAGGRNEYPVARWAADSVDQCSQ